MKTWIGSVAAIGITATGFLATGDAALSQSCPGVALNGIPASLRVEDPELCGHIPSGLGYTNSSVDGYRYILDRYDRRWVSLFLSPSAAVANPPFHSRIIFMDCSDKRGYEFVKRTGTSAPVGSIINAGQQGKTFASVSFWNTMCQGAGYGG